MLRSPKRWHAPAFGLATFVAGLAVGFWWRGEGPRSAPSARSHRAAAAAPNDDAPASTELARSSAPASPREAAPNAESRQGRASTAVIGARDDDGARTRAAQASDTPARRTGVRDGGAAPRGRLAPTAIRDVVRAHREQLQFCFEWQLHRHPELGGRLVMAFTIGEDGRVTHADVVQDELGDETVLRCFRRVTERMRFPPPEGGEVEVRYPFALSSR